MKESTNISQVSRDDMAFFNSVLSYGIYTDREWMLGLNEFGQTNDAKSFDEAVTEAAFELFKSNAPPKEIMKRNYELYLSAYVKNNFSKVSINSKEEFEFCSPTYGYKTKCQFQESDYIALNNLARAGYFLSKNEDGSQNLHLVFRGTDKKARDFSEFVGKAYLDMSAYYEAFKPLEEKILEFAKNPANNIKTVHVSGHSLGGAMVQEFFNSYEVKTSGLDLVGFTYGAPGADKKPLHSVVTETFHTVKKFFKTGKFSAFSDLALKTIAPAFNQVLPGSLAFGNALSVGTGGFDFAEVIPQINSPVKRSIDDRIFQYEHSGDLIPKLGAAVYNESGREIYLKDIASQNVKETFMLTGRREQNYKHKFFSFMSESFNLLVKKPIRFVKNMFQFEYHDMMRYVVNLEHKIVNDTDKTNSPYYNQFMDFKERFTRNTSNKTEDLIFQRIIDKQNLHPVEKKMVYVRLPKELEDKMNKFHYIQTTKNVVSDILGKPVSYDMQKFTMTMHGTNEPVQLGVSSTPENITEIAKNVVSQETPDNYLITFKQSANNIHTLRTKFLNQSKENKNNFTV